MMAFLRVVFENAFQDIGFADFSKDSKNDILSMTCRWILNAIPTI